MEKCRTGKLNLPKNLKGYARDLVKNLLVEDPTARLELSQIKEHPFFKAINWSKLKKRLIEPPCIPKQVDLYADNHKIDMLLSTEKEKEE
jgi:serine/threonine protein kinase